MEVNRPLKDIIHEVEALSTRGCIEITLLGQIVNHYRAPDPHYFSSNNPYHHNDFAKLLWEVGRISGIQRVHWTAPHPLYMDEEVIDALGLPNQVQYLHLPVQSGNDEILKRMNRRHTRAFYLDTINNIRIAYPRIAIGTDIIVGFPGETDVDFAETLSLMEEVGFDGCFAFKFSPRSGTPAVDLPDQAPEPVKAAADMSKFLLSPMPGLLTQIAVTAGQEVKAGEILAKIEAMKMENVLKAERDCVVEKLLAKPGESLAVDQAIIAFR